MQCLTNKTILALMTLIRVMGVDGQGRTADEAFVAPRLRKKLAHVLSTLDGSAR